MNIYIAHSGSYDYKNELYIPLRNSNLNNLYNIVLPHEKSFEPYNSKDFFKSKCDLVVAEVSFPSTGMGIELGWADFYKIPIICIYKEGYKPSNSLKTITNKIFSYSDSADMINKLTIALQ